MSLFFRLSERILLLAIMIATLSIVPDHANAQYNRRFYLSGGAGVGVSSFVLRHDQIERLYDMDAVYTGEVRPVISGISLAVPTRVKATQTFGKTGVFVELEHHYNLFQSVKTNFITTRPGDFTFNRRTVLEFFAFNVGIERELKSFMKNELAGTISVGTYYGAFKTNFNVAQFSKNYSLRTSVNLGLIYYQNIGRVAVFVQPNYSLKYMRYADIFKNAYYYRNSQYGINSPYNVFLNSFCINVGFRVKFQSFI